MPRVSRPWIKPVVIALWWVVCLGVSDVAIGKLFGRRLALHQDEKSLTYRHDSELGWIPTPGSKKEFTGSRPIHIEHNSRGFRDVEHVIDDRPRMTFIGDSYVWGYDVEQAERFTDKLREAIPNWSIYNLGVSGYGTDQEYLVLKRQFDFYRPQIVFLIFCRDNDDDDNSRSGRAGIYYKPYFSVESQGLVLRGVPVPQSEGYFFARHDWLAHSNWARLIMRAHAAIAGPPVVVAAKPPTREILLELNAFVTSKGAKLLVGLQDAYPELAQFLTEQHIPNVDLSNPHRYPGQSRHWTPEGHSFVRDRIVEFLDAGQHLRTTAPREQR